MKRILFVATALSLAACGVDNSGATREQRQQQQLQDQSSIVVGMPAITNFTEKRMLKMIYELRDSSNLVTYAYYLDLNGGEAQNLPNDIGRIGFPYATQYTAPKAPRIVYPMYPNGSQATSSAHTYDAEQPEPNGLYMPSSADGTWVVCLAPDGKNLMPTYVEPRVIVSQFPMKSVDDPR